MGAVLGLGVTHQPTLSDAEMLPGSFRRTLADPDLPEQLRDPSGWPAGLREEWGDDRGAAAGRAHQAAVAEEFRRLRGALDEFDPDVVIVWGDDQYERFRETCVPAFCVIADESFTVKPWDGHAKPNLWGEPAETEVKIGGHRQAAKWLAGELLERDFDVSYSYGSPVLSHAFVNTVLYLDWDRRGFPYPIVPFAVNCYGGLLTLTSGGRVPLRSLYAPVDLDPPAPSPRRCFELGRACARALRQGGHRVALIASSSWSHGFLTRKHHYLYPDVEADRRLLGSLERGDYEPWRRVTAAEISDSGQQEMLNWFCLAGAMAELGSKPSYLEMVETSLLNSNKVFAIFPPGEGHDGRI